MSRSLLATLLVLSALAATAQPIKPEQVPPELRGWVPWVLEDVAGHGCPVVGGTPICLWPGRLRLELGAASGRFTMEVRSDREASLRLPGDARRWPQEVKLDGQPAPVFEADGGPSLRLAPGDHRVEGRFLWPALPESLAVPPTLALVDLAIDGRVVALPQREENGLLWLRRAEQPTGGGEALRVQVFRKLTDGIPQWLETRLALEVAGKAREVEFPGALLPGSAPVAIQGDLPARLDARGKLRVQVRAGSFAVTLLSRLETRVEALAPAAAEEPWPEREVWVFAADEHLREVQPGGAPAVDPSRTDLPQEWRTLPAFLVDASQKLTLAEVRRGQPEAGPDKLALQRELWLDVDGGGYTVRDSLSGTLGRTTRLDLDKPGSLGRVSVGGTDQLVTANPAGGAPGVELRGAALSLQADSRLPRGELPAVGWSARVDSLALRLHLPPGWRLLGATGSDRVAGAWTSRVVNLPAFFFILLVGFGVDRLFGRRTALLALLAMLLAYGEPGAPGAVWIVLLAATALARVAPEGRLRRLASGFRIATLIVLGVVLAPFAAGQIKAALFPQTLAIGGFAEGRSGGGFDLGMATRSAEAPIPQAVAPAAPPAEMAELESKAAATASFEEGRQVLSDSSAPQRRQKSKTQSYSYNQALEQDPHAVLQTGPGVPGWSWGSHELSWSGPVDPTQRVRLFLLSPFAALLLTAVRLALLLLLAARLAGLKLPAPPPPPAPAAQAIAALLLLFLAAPDARAQENKAPEPPDPALLEELKQRLTRPEPCAPNCVTTADLLVRVSGETLAFSAEVHAAARAAWALPGPASAWVPSDVRVDGQSAAALVRLGDGFLHLRLSPGVHRVEASGPLSPADTLTLQLRARPRHASVEAAGFDVVGVREDGSAEEQIQLNRRLRATTTTGERSASYAPWLEITRTLAPGVTWRVTTHVRRVSPAGAPVAVRIPLLPGESLTEGGFEVEKGEAVIGLSRDQTEADWASSLEPREALELQAPEGKPWSEVWVVACSVVWQCQAEGLPPVQREQQGLLHPEYRPWPGEKLKLAFRHPAGVPGQTLTIDSARLEVTPGQRVENARLDLSVRTSRDDALILDLPADVEVREVKVRDQVRPARPENGKLRLSLPAGPSAVSVTWQASQGIGPWWSLRWSLPQVGLSAPAVNVTQVAHVPEERWLLLAWGPTWGPSVLFWAHLAFALLAAYALSRLPGSPLRLAEWMLLALGLVPSELAAACIVVGFLLALAWRGRAPRPTAWGHDGLQLALAFWGLVAALVLADVVHGGLVQSPDMHVEGFGSSARELRWFSDRVPGALPHAGILSLPIWAYRIATLAWALWLAASVVRWTGWAWTCFNAGGLWRALSLPKRPTIAEAKPSGPETLPPTGEGTPQASPAEPKE
jgi:hypothetical protein